MATKIQLRRDTLVNWLKADPVLMDGEQVLVATNASQPTVYDSKKVGDGTHKFSELEMLGYECLQTTGDSQLFPMSQKAVTDLFNSDNFIIADLPYRNRLIEAYFTGLDNTHTYDFQFLRYFESGNYKAIQVYLRDKTTNTVVALVEKTVTTDYIGVVEVAEKNSSGVNGYVLVDIKTTDKNTFTNTLNVNKVSVLENSPLLREYLYPHILKSQYDNDQEIMNDKIDTLEQKVLDVSLFKTVSDSTLLRRIKQIRLYGAVNQNESYKIKLCRYVIISDFKAYQIYIADSTDDNVCILELQSDSDVTGIYKLVEWNNSGIYGYVYLNMLTTDTQNMTAELNISEVFAYEQLYTPQMAESLPFASMTSPTGLGNYRKDGSSGFTAVTATTIAGFQNMNSNIDGVIKSISFCSKGTSMKFGIGIIDQRNIAVIRKTFEVNCTADALNTINLAKQGLQIYKGETLFAIFSSNETSICFRNNSSATADVQMVYGFKGRELHTLKTDYGGRLNLYWEVAQIDSPFALKDDIVNVSEKADAANKLASEALSNFGLVKDRQGNYYQLIVVDGAISIIPLVYKKVLVICNSIGLNGRLYNQGWCGRRGMASSRYGLDYKSHLENGLKQKDADAIVVLINVWNWERDFDSITPADLMNGYLDSDVDCIIFRAGENVPNGKIADFQENLTGLLNYCISQCPNANIFITSMVWANEGKDLALQNTALSMGVPLIDVLSSDAIYKERIGNYLEGDYTPDGGATWDTEQQILYKVLGSGIAEHTNDVGMLRIANNILSALKYEQLELLRNINIGDTGGYTCSIITNKWVVGGIVNVVSNGNTVSVSDSDNTLIEVTNHNDGVFTFIMPNKDVTITVS